MNQFAAFLLSAVMLVPALLIAIPVHEMGHAAAAYLQGDRSVRYFGYFTLNPRRFIDPIGVIAVFVALVGWGRKVPVQPNRISTVRQRLVHALGGPIANLVVALVLGLVLRTLIGAGLRPSLTLSSGLVAYLIYAVWFLNLSLFAFHLLPIPGLDGWDILEIIFRSRAPRFFFNASVRRREIWAGVVIVIFVGSLIGVPVLSYVMTPFYKPASLISLGQCTGYGVPGFNALYPCLL
ncbi:MAG TPA: site-2 protease family protein [Candidatus Eisenbacteria bacterium]|nr:site-2 protease family protein [Candidatus Eisenbacteria bacterium]